MAKVLPFRPPRKRAPAHVLRKVAGRPASRTVRSREYLTPAEVERLMAAAGGVGRHRLRDRTLLLVAYRHGLRVSELVDLKWDQVDFAGGRLHVNRLKNGNPA